uniref:Protein-tyrosine-phosphatase n=1 Tax=Caenorhabditis japonica TaxID=281687 RepID=A0A8R1DJI0_CAEJA
MCITKKAIKKENVPKRKAVIKKESSQRSNDVDVAESKKDDTSVKGSKKSMKIKTPAPDAKAMKIVKPWVQRALDMGVPSLMDEFKTLSKWTPDGMTTEAFNANKDKNRYQDVPCQDKGRVVLKFGGYTGDYIHANYVSTPRDPKRFICAQGPLENTQHAFWAMAVQEKVETIIMLCNCIEKMKIKCHQYWPEEKDKKLSFGEAPNQIHITNLGAKKMSPDEQCINETSLKVEWADGTRTIRHLQWENWPDRGVPETNLTAINLLSYTRATKFSILVHCSAGIGRTGTIVAISYVMDKMMAGDDCMAMNELLKELRSQRPWSIQNEFQYLYLHRVLLAYFLERHKEMYGDLLKGENGAKYDKWMEEYKLATAQP